MKMNVLLIGTIASSIILIGKPGAAENMENGSFEKEMQQKLHVLDGKISKMAMLEERIEDKTEDVYERKVSELREKVDRVQRKLVVMGMKKEEERRMAKEKINTMMDKLQTCFNNFAEEQKKNYLGLLEDDVSYYERRIEEVIEKIEQEPGSTESKLKQIAGLKEMQEKARKEIKGLKSADDRIWDKSQNLAERALEDLKQAYNEVISSIR